MRKVIIINQEKDSLIWKIITTQASIYILKLHPILYIIYRECASKHKYVCGDESNASKKEARRESPMMTVKVRFNQNVNEFVSKKK
jgi:RIO-like serine/threonine protein kinase